MAEVLGAGEHKKAGEVQLLHRGVEGVQMLHKGMEHRRVEEEGVKIRFGLRFFTSISSNCVYGLSNIITFVVFPLFSGTSWDRELYSM